MRKERGFTLIEVLVALAVMAVLAALAWRGVDAMVRARDGSQGALERTARLATILTQWQQDFAALYDGGVAPPVAFDGRTMLLTRSVDGGVAVVAWSLRESRWQRWMSPATTRAAALQETWLRGQQLLGNEAGQVTLLDDVSTWQIYFYRGNGWSNAQSSGDIAAPPTTAASGAAPRETLPDGVRLVVTTAAGTLTRDLTVGPSGS